MEKVSKLYKAKTGVRCVGFHSKVSLNVKKKNERRNRGEFGKGGAEWKMAATSLHDDVFFFDSEECHESDTDCADADIVSLVRSL